MMNEKVETFMIRKLITLTPGDTIAHAKEVLSDKRIHHLPVQDDEKLVGLVTTNDFWKSSAEKHVNDKTKISDIMSKKVVKISPDDKIGPAAEIFPDNRFHALPVVADNSTLVGLSRHLTSSDMNSKKNTRIRFFLKTSWITALK